MSAADEWDELFLEWGLDNEGQPLALSVETYTDDGMLGPTYADPESIPGLPQMGQARLVQDSEGNQVTSSTAVYAPLARRDAFTPHSRVTLATGRQAIVVGVAEADSASLFSFLRIDCA